MKLEDQVAPLALAQRMKELGFPQGCVFAWFGYDNDPKAFVVDVRDSDQKHAPYPDDREMEAFRNCAAPTVAEIGEALRKLQNPRRYVSEYFDREDPDWEVALYDRLESREIAGGIGATEAEARARLWIALAEVERAASS